MDIKTEVYFVDLKASDAILFDVHSRIDRLSALFPEVSRIKVKIIKNKNSHTFQRFFNVQLQIKIPTGYIVSMSSHHDTYKFTNLYQALHSSFKNAERQLRDSLEIMKGKVKSKTSIAAQIDLMEKIKNESVDSLEYIF